MTQFHLWNITEGERSTICLPQANSSLYDVLQRLPHPSIFVQGQRFLPLGTPVQEIPTNAFPLIYFRDLVGPIPDHASYASLRSLQVDDIEDIEDLSFRRPFIPPASPDAIADNAPLGLTTGD
jgi:hypothetical protein